ncbi:MAG TPA: WcaI family glycosyltransferase, partial [Dyadobacter sp.]|nr:WcaI family glycosyltransferase [Dyadobacter sp.]
MRILIFGINYAPELTGIGKYTGEMAAWLAGEGHEVTMITALPYYPEWRVHAKYRGKMWVREILDGVNVYRCPLYVPAQVTALKRIIHEFTFLAAILPVWFASLFQKKYDVVFCVSPPFHLGLLPMLYAKFKGAKLINHIQDLQVDAAKDLGMIKSKRFLDVMFGTEKYLLEKGDVVSTISTGMQRKIEQKGISPDRIWQFPNWVDESAVKPLPISQSLRREFGIPDTASVIMYSGNLGEKQGLEIIIEVAKHFEGQDHIHFIIVGSGGAKEKLEAMVREAGLNNVGFHP